MDPVAAIAWIVAFVVVTVTVTGLIGSRRMVGTGRARARRRRRVVHPRRCRASRIEPDLVLYGAAAAAAVRGGDPHLAPRRPRPQRQHPAPLGRARRVHGRRGRVRGSWLIMPAITPRRRRSRSAPSSHRPTPSRSPRSPARLPLPRRVVTILEGESLLNDATALVALNAAIAAIMSVVNPVEVVGEFVVAVVVGGGGRTRGRLSCCPRSASSCARPCSTPACR